MLKELRFQNWLQHNFHALLYNAVSKAGEAQSLVFYNQKKGGLIIQKRDSITGDPLSGAEFLITTIDGQYVDDNEGQTSTKGIYRTDAYGQIVLTNILPNTYVVRETKAPDGYILDGEEQSVNGMVGLLRFRQKRKKRPGDEKIVTEALCSCYVKFV